MLAEGTKKIFILTAAIKLMFRIKVSMIERDTVMIEMKLL
jgi:hypothetical protein